MNEAATARERYGIGDLVLDLETASLRHGDEPVHLKGLTFDLLVCLARHAPAVATHQALLEEVWRDANVGEETLKQRVKLLRKALGDNSKTPRFVETVRGRGYRLIPAVRRLEDAPPVLAPVAAPRRTWPQALAVTLTLAAIAAIAYFAGGLTGGPRNAVPSNRLQASELFERGRLYYHRYLPKDNQVAIDLLTRAVAADPDCYKAHALLSRAYSQQPKLGNGYWGDHALRAAEAAIRLAPGRPQGYLALGIYHDVAGEPLKGIEAYESVLERQAGNGDAWSNAAYDFMILGRLVEAATWNAKGLALNPNGHFGMVQMGDILRLLGLTVQARPWLEKAVALQPDNIFARVSLSKLRMLERDWQGAMDLVTGEFPEAANRAIARSQAALIHFFQGDLASARNGFQGLAADGSLDAEYRFALILQRLGSSEADAMLSRVEARIAKLVASGVHDPSNEVSLGALAAVSGRRDEALAWLERARERGFTDVTWLARDPALAVLRDRTDFRALVRRLEQDIAGMRDEVEGLELGL